MAVPRALAAPPGTASDHAWHPLALARELADGGYLQARLLGRTWTVHRRAGALRTDPPAWGVVERDGVLWLAPAEPVAEHPPLPRPAAPGTVATWLDPVRSPATVGPLLDALGGADAGPGPVPLRLPAPAGGVRRSALVALQPEDADSTRVYARVQLAGPGDAAPAADVVADEVAAVARVLAADLARACRRTPATG